VISARILPPSFLPNLSSVCRSRGVTEILLGSLDRRMRFSALRYSTMRANSRSVAWAITSTKDGITAFIGVTIEPCRKCLAPRDKTRYLTTAAQWPAAPTGGARTISGLAVERLRHRRRKQREGARSGGRQECGPGGPTLAGRSGR